MLYYETITTFTNQNAYRCVTHGDNGPDGKCCEYVHCGLQ